MSGNATTATPTTVVTTSSTSDGFIVGVEPAQSPDQIRAAQQDPAQSQAQTTAPQAPQTNGERLFTADQVETFRQQEKDKVYSRMEQMDKELSELRAQREAEAAEKAAALAEAEAEAKRKAEEGMEVRDLLVQTRAEFESELARVREDAERAQAMLEQERRLQELTVYRQQAIAANSDRLVPEIADFIGGDSQEQIDASVADAIARSESIVQGALAVRQAQVQGMQGTRTTAPSGNGPLEEQQEQRQISVEDIKRMSPSEYAASRGILHQAGRNQFYGNRG